MLVIIISFWVKCNVFMCHVGEEKCWDLLIEVFLSHICPLFFFLFIYLYIYIFFFGGGGGGGCVVGMYVCVHMTLFLYAAC